MANPKTRQIDDGRFSECSQPTEEEAGTVRDKNGKDLSAGDDDFMRVLAETHGFEYTEED